MDNLEISVDNPGLILIGVLGSTLQRLEAHTDSVEGLTARDPRPSGHLRNAVTTDANILRDSLDTLTRDWISNEN